MIAEASVVQVEGGDAPTKRKFRRVEAESADPMYGNDLSESSETERSSIEACDGVRPSAGEFGKASQSSAESEDVMASSLL